MNKKHTKPNYMSILNVLYIIISLVAMAIFFFTPPGLPEEYLAINAIAMWGTILAALIAVVLVVGVVIRAKR